MVLGLQQQALLRLMTWMSPAFPVGGFAYSSGLERAVFDGLVTHASDLLKWIEVQLMHGSIWNDAILLNAAHKAVQRADDFALEAVLALAEAMAGSAERHLETTAQGRAFRDAAMAWPHAVFDLLPRAPAYPVAVGAVAAAHAIGAEQALCAYMQAAVSQSLSQGIRLSVLGQKRAVAMQAELEVVILSVAQRASRTQIDDLGTAAFCADMMTARHETQAVRLFRS